MKIGNIELKGQGCREFEALNPDKTWDDLLKFFVLDYDANVKRIDIAIDHFDNKPVDYIFLTSHTFS